MILLNAVDPKAIEPAVKKAKAAGIVVVAVDVAAAGADATVQTNNVQAGQIACDFLAKKLNGKGNVVIMMGDLANNSTRGRTAGVKEVLAKYPDIKIVEEQTANFERTKAIDLMSNWISKGDKIDAVASNNDEMAIGAIIALQQAGLSPKKIFVGGVDATPDALAEMQKGNLAVTVFQNAKGQGERSLDDAVRMIKGEKVQQFDFIPYELVTPENYKTFLNR